MATMRRSDVAKQLTGLIRGVIGNYKDRPFEWSQVFDTESSIKAFEEEVLMTGTGIASIKPEGQGVNYDSAKESYTARWDMLTVALALSITEEAVEDNIHLKLASKAGVWLERSYRNTQEIIAANVLNYGFDGTNHPMGDGQAIFSTTHPVIGGGFQSNKLATPADLSESSLEDLLIQIDQAKDDRGMIIALQPRRLIIPPQLRFVAHRLLQSKLRTGTTDNDLNAINDMGIFGAEPVLMRRLTDADAWFIKTDALDGLKHFNRVAMKTAVDPGEFETGDYRVKVRGRFAFGVGDWRGAWGSEGSG
jgi:hypothetical protein